MRAGLVLGVLLALTAAGVVATLSARGTRIAGTNGLHMAGPTVSISGGASACQPIAGLPDDTGAVALQVDADQRPTPPLTVRFFTAAGDRVATGRLPGGLREGRLIVPLGHVSRGDRPATVCVHDGGQARVALGGDLAPPANAARVGQGRPQGTAALTYLRPGRESWWPLLGGIAHRFGLGKASLLGGWTLWVAAAVLLCVWGAVSWLLVSERPR